MQFTKKPGFGKLLIVIISIIILLPFQSVLAQADGQVGPPAPAAEEYGPPAPAAAQPAAQSSWLTLVSPGTKIIGNIAYNETGTPKDIRVIVAGIVQVVLGLLATIFIIMIIIAGTKWMASQGNATKITEARQTIIAASVGLIIILASFAITIYISRSIVATTGRANPSNIIYYRNQ
ncbi:MAG: hypothetical protein WCO55_00765 [Candidatus Falkowbacteria bacterium]